MEQAMQSIMKVGPSKPNQSFKSDLCMQRKKHCGKKEKEKKNMTTTQEKQHISMRNEAKDKNSEFKKVHNNKRHEKILKPIKSLSHSQYGDTLHF